MKQLIIGISGYKGSGKDTLANSLYRYRNDFVHESRPGTASIYGFADEAKAVCVKFFGLDPKIVYGTDADKNAYTDIKWQDMPHWREIYENEKEKVEKKVAEWYKKLSLIDKLFAWWGGDRDRYYQDLLFNATYRYEIRMTYRQVLQEVLTGVFRRIKPNCHVLATLAKIKESGDGVNFIKDVRFPDEANSIKNEGGVVIRLTRNVAGEDQHESETKLNPDVFDWSQFDIVLDNANLDVDAQARQAMLGLASLGLVRDIHVGRPFDGSKVLTVNQ